MSPGSKEGSLYTAAYAMHWIMSSAGARRGAFEEETSVPPADPGGGNAESCTVTQEQPLAGPGVDRK